MITEGERVGGWELTAQHATGMCQSGSLRVEVGRCGEDRKSISLTMFVAASTFFAAAPLAVSVGSGLAPICPAVSGRCAIKAVSEFERFNPHVKEMRETAKRISRRGRGILATDESIPTAGKRLGTIGMPNTELTRRGFREVLYTTEGLGEYISGVIMFDETVYQTTASGLRLTEVLQKEGIVVGVKVDTGLQPLSGTEGETATQGLDGLAERCRAYYEEGARFTKWRAVFKIGDNMPSERAIAENAHTLARYASICQEHGLVPIVEPELTLGPGDYSIERAAYESQRVLSHVFRALNTHDVRAHTGTRQHLWHHRIAPKGSPDNRPLSHVATSPAPRWFSRPCCSNLRWSFPASMPRSRRTTKRRWRG